VADAPDGPRLTVIGEALIDLVPGTSPGCYQAKPGGSPFNVAIGLARLGHRTTLMARLADDPFGDLLREHAAAENIDLGCAPLAAEPTTLAVVGLDRDARASYSFYLQGTADWQWTDAETARLPKDTTVFHMGSLASWTHPGDERIHAAAVGLRRDGEVLISYDPNIRPAILGQPARVRSLVERSVSVAHIVKASREDADWLYRGASLDQVGGRWIDLGALLVVITDGPRGAHFFQPGAAPVHRPGREVRVADTIGAGDAFTAGLLSGLTRRGLHAPERVRRCPPALLAEAVDEAVLISALTCERVGADPPFAVNGPHRDPRAPLTPADLAFTAPPLRPPRNGPSAMSSTSLTWHPPNRGVRAPGACPRAWPGRGRPGSCGPPLSGRN
jgi:fructokinase